MTDWQRRVGAMTLFVPDLGEAQKFYADAFGLDVQRLDDDAAMLTLEGMYMFMHQVAAVAPMLPEVLEEGRKGAGQFAILVADVDAVCAEITGRGVQLLAGLGDREWGMRTATFVAPGGYIWEIAQPVPPTTKEP